MARRWLERTCSVMVMSLAFVVVSCTIPSSTPDKPRTVRIQARKFAFTPESVRVRRGSTVILELESLDRVHGFELPDLGRRADIVPGHLARVELTPREAGSFPFRCDVFCGDGHEQMVGTLVVESGD